MGKRVNKKKKEEKRRRKKRKRRHSAMRVYARPLSFKLLSNPLKPK